MSAMSIGLMQPISAEPLMDGARVQALQKEQATEANNAPLLQGLARYVWERWDEAKQARQAVLPRLQAAHRARSGEYSPSKLASIREFGGSEVFLRVIANKSMILLALLKDVYLGQTDKPWSLKPTAVPAFPAEMEQEVRDQLAQELAAFYAQFGQLPDMASIRAAHADMQDAAEQRLQEMARKMAERMERKMADQLSEGGFDSAIAEFLTDFVTFPTAILKGPTLRRRKKMSWGVGPNGKTAPTVTDEIVPEFDRVDPFRAYFAPGSDSPQRGFFIELEALQYDDLYGMIGAPGVNETAVRAALSEAENGGLANWVGTSTLSDIPDQDNVSPSLKRDTFNIDAVLFYGPVKGRDLIEWGIEDPIDDPDASYEAAVWLVGKWVIKAHLNYDPLGVRPYFSASYCAIPGQAHGESVPDLLKDLAGDDGLMQVGARSLANNMAMASGPMVGINTDRLQQGETLNTLHPWQMFQLKNSEYGNQVDRPLEFYQPNMHAQELLAVLDKLDRYADSFSMIPRSAAGESPTGGVGRSASGLAMQLDAASKGLKAAVMSVDAALAGLLGKLFSHNMQFDPDETIKGDVQVIARGATSLMQLESLRVRRNEAINTINQSPMAQQIVGIEGMGEILRTTLDDLDIDVTRVIPSREKLAAMAAPQAPPGAAPDAAPGASQEVLPSGHATTDNFSPNPTTPQGYASGGLVDTDQEANDQREFAMNTTPGNQGGSYQDFKLGKLERQAADIVKDDRWSRGHQLTAFQQERKDEQRGALVAGAKAFGAQIKGAGQPQQPQQPDQAAQDAAQAAAAPKPPKPDLAPTQNWFAPPTIPGIGGMSTSFGADPDPLGLS